MHALQEAVGNITAPKITEHEHEVQHKVVEHDRHEHEEQERMCHKEKGAGGGPMKEMAAAAETTAEKPQAFEDAMEPEAKPESTTEAAPEGEGGM